MRKLTPGREGKRCLAREVEQRFDPFASRLLDHRRRRAAGIERGVLIPRCHEPVGGQSRLETTADHPAKKAPARTAQHPVVGILRNPTNNLFSLHAGLRQRSLKRFPELSQRRPRCHRPFVETLYPGFCGIVSVIKSFGHRGPLGWCNASYYAAGLPRSISVSCGRTPRPPTWIGRKSRIACARGLARVRLLKGALRIGTVHNPDRFQMTLPSRAANLPMTGHDTREIRSDRRFVMSYTYNLSPASSFEDRYSQFIAFGIPKADVDTLRATIKDMWADAPGGWSYEWSAFARKYLSVGNSLLASFAARPSKKTLRCSSSTAQTTISSRRRIRSSSKVAPKPKSTCYRTLDVVPCWVVSRSCRK